jgi:hypothetical protein
MPASALCADWLRAVHSARSPEAQTKAMLLQHIFRHFAPRFAAQPPSAAAPRPHGCACPPALPPQQAPQRLRWLPPRSSAVGPARLRPRPGALAPQPQPRERPAPQLDGGEHGGRPAAPRAADGAGHAAPGPRAPTEALPRPLRAAARAAPAAPGAGAGEDAHPSLRPRSQRLRQRRRAGLPGFYADDGPALAGCGTFICNGRRCTPRRAPHRAPRRAPGRLRRRADAPRRAALLARDRARLHMTLDALDRALGYSRSHTAAVPGRPEQRREQRRQPAQLTTICAAEAWGRGLVGLAVPAHLLGDMTPAQWPCLPG